MLTIKIYTKCLNQQEKSDLEKLLKETGYEVATIEDEGKAEGIGIVPKEGEGCAVTTGEVLIILINPACEADAGLEDAVQQAARASCRVIGVWPRGATDGKVPLALEKYGSDVITWNPKKLRAAVEESAALWETTAGAPRAEPPTKRNRC